MPVLKREFYHHEKGNHDETWFYLARDTDNGRVFVIREWAARADLGEKPMELTEFLAKHGKDSSGGNLMRLIGSLIPDA